MSPPGWFAGAPSISTFVKFEFPPPRNIVVIPPYAPSCATLIPPDVIKIGASHNSCRSLMSSCEITATGKGDLSASIGIVVADTMTVADSCLSAR